MSGEIAVGHQAAALGKQPDCRTGRLAADRIEHDADGMAVGRGNDPLVPAGLIGRNHWQIRKHDVEARSRRLLA